MTLDELLLALRGSIEQTVRALGVLLDDPAAGCSATRRLLGEAVVRDFQTAGRAAWGALLLPLEERASLAEQLMGDGRAEVRAALFEAWSPARLDKPGRSPQPLQQPQLDLLLRRGLTDPDDRVRAQAAALTFETDRGALLADELLANLGADHSSSLRWSATLALGAARDPASLSALIALVSADEAELALAAAAARALAFRSDGAEPFAAVLEDPREEIRNAAAHGLAASRATWARER